MRVLRVLARDVPFCSIHAEDTAKGGCHSLWSESALNSWINSTVTYDGKQRRTKKTCRTWSCRRMRVDTLGRRISSIWTNPIEANDHVLSALAMPVHSWKHNMDTLISLRREIRKQTWCVHQQGDSYKPASWREGAIFKALLVEERESANLQQLASKRFRTRERCPFQCGIKQEAGGLGIRAASQSLSAKHGGRWRTFLYLRATQARNISTPESVDGTVDTILFPIGEEVDFTMCQLPALSRIPYSCDPTAHCLYS